MAAIPAARLARPAFASGGPDLVLPFLAPSIQCSKSASLTSAARFSTSPALWKRDNNRNRGVSVLRHTGLRKRQTLSVNQHITEIPKPVTPERVVESDDDHGLWDFFYNKERIRKPSELQNHGMTRSSLYMAQGIQTDLPSRTAVDGCRASEEDLARFAQLVVGVRQGAQPNRNRCA